MQHTITVSPTRLRIREFLDAKSHLGASVSLTLIRLNDWMGSAKSGALGLPGDCRKSNLIENVASTLVGNGKQTQRMLLSKSLQEALYYSVGFNTNLDCTEFKVRFSRYLHRHGPSSFMRRFLSLYFFNFVWSEIGESFRALSRSSEAFEEYMEEVERISQRAVGAVWRSFEKMESPLSLAAATELVQKIEHRLRGN